MDKHKCRALKLELAAQPEPQIVPIEKFFNGNDDLGSIGCNLTEHPGMEVFHDVFANLLRQPGVEGIYAQIAELDAGEDCWPFTDTVFVVGAISSDQLQTILSPLQPDEVGATLEVPPLIKQKHHAPVLVAWWD